MTEQPDKWVSLEHAQNLVNPLPPRQIWLGKHSDQLMELLREISVGGYVREDWVVACEALLSYTHLPHIYHPPAVVMAIRGWHLLSRLWLLYNPPLVLVQGIINKFEGASGPVCLISPGSGIGTTHPLVVCTIRPKPDTLAARGVTNPLITCVACKARRVEQALRG